MLTLEECRKIFERKLYSEELIKKPKELYEPIDYILSVGGKRLRPALLLMIHSIYKEINEDALKSAMAVEIFHNFTLVHDDIMDNAELRRNHETVHKRWNANIAILSGDAMLIKAFEYILSTRKDVKDDLLQLFNKTALQVCEGQQYDMNFEKKQHISIDEYLEMIKLKTSVLLAASMKMGAITANASEDDRQNIYDFGKNIGIAFQLQDDYLDVYADEKIFGKKIGGDIISNKKTYLLASVLNIADEKKIELIKDWMDKKDFNPSEKIKVFKEVYKEFDIQKKTLEKILFYYENGLQKLTLLNIPQKTKELLKETIKKMMVRDK